MVHAYLTKAVSFGGLDLLGVHFHSCINLKFNRDTAFTEWFFISSP